MSGTVIHKTIFVNKKNLAGAPLSKIAESWGFNCVNVPGDGNCFFHAVTAQLKQCGLLNAKENHRVIRQRVAKHISENLQAYADFMTDDVGDYLKNIKRNGVWADHLMIQAFARAYNVSLVIINSNPPFPTVIKRPDARAVLYIGHEGEIHYQSLIKVRDFIKLRKLVKNAEIDNFQENNEKQRDAHQLKNISMFSNAGKSSQKDLVEITPTRLPFLRAKQPR